MLLTDFRSANFESAQNELLESLSREGYCFVESGGSSEVLHILLSELSKFFQSASAEEKNQLQTYRSGFLRGYFPPLDPEGGKLERRKERFVFGGENNLFPGRYPHLKQAFNQLYLRHVRPIADTVYGSLQAYLESVNPDWAKRFQQFFLNPYSGEFEPSVLTYAMHYPAVRNAEKFLNQDHTVTISDPHVDMTTFTILPRGTGGATKMFDKSGKIIPIYDTSLSHDAMLIFVGKTLENLLEGIPYRNRNGTFPFRAFRHTVMNTPEEVAKHRDVIGYFFNGNLYRRYSRVRNAEEFGSIFIDRRPSAMQRAEPLRGMELTVRDRQYLTEQLFYSDVSPNAAMPPITLKQFKNVN